MPGFSHYPAVPRPDLDLKYATRPERTRSFDSSEDPLHRRGHLLIFVLRVVLAFSKDVRSTSARPSTSLIVNQPRLPWIHRAASARRANAVRSRTLCVSVSFLRAVEPDRCVPGMKPARVDETSIGRGNPALHPAFISNAVPDGASFFAA